MPNIQTMLINTKQFTVFHYKGGSLCKRRANSFRSRWNLIFLMWLKHATANAILKLPIIQPHLPSIGLIPASILLASSAISVFLWSFLWRSHPEQVFAWEIAWNLNPVRGWDNCGVGWRMQCILTRTTPTCHGITLHIQTCPDLCGADANC